MIKIFDDEKILIVIAVIVISILTISNNFVKALQHKYYLDIDSNNRDYIEQIISENYKLIGRLNRIGCMQELGEWCLFLNYEHGIEDNAIFRDSDEKVQPLHNYIIENGYNEGEVSLNKIKLSFCAILGAIIYEVSYLNIKKKKCVGFKDTK